MNNLDEINSKINTLSEAIKSNPDNWEIYLVRGSAYSYRGSLSDSIKDYASAIEDFTKSIELKPDNLWIYDVRGIAYNNRGFLSYSTEDSSSAIEDFTKAIEDFTKTIGFKPDNWEIYYQRGIAYNKRGYLSDSTEDCSSAIEDLTKAIELNSDNWEIYFKRGIAYDKRAYLSDSTKDCSSAIEDLTKAIGLNPDNWELHLWKGMTYFNRGTKYYQRGIISDVKEDCSSAIEDFTKAIGLNPDNWEIYLMRGRAYYNRGEILKGKDHSLAIKDYTKAIGLNPDNREIYYYRGLAYYQRGIISDVKEDCSLAIEDFTKAIGLNQDNWEIYRLRGLAYHSISKHTECIEDINASLYLASKHKVKLKPILDKVELVYSTEPFNHWSWLICLIDTNQFSPSILAKYIDLQAQLYDFLLVFKYFEYSQIELTSHNSDFLRIIPILIYHLKGCVTSYRLFDERLDDEDTYQLTAQEYYYYIRSAFHFCKECKEEMGVQSIINYAINKLSARTDLNEDDYYYWGLIYYIQILEFGFDGEDMKALEEKALCCFNQSTGFIWSRAMVDLIENDTYSDEINRFIQEHCNLQREIDIEPLLSVNASGFLHQFDDYLHFQEITDIFPYLVSSVKYYEPIWEVFTLNEYDTATLKNKLHKKSVDEIFQKVVEEKKREGIQKLSQEEIEEIENDKTISIFVNLPEKEKVISLFLELTINSDRKNKDAFFEILRRYIYHSGKISIEEYLLLGYYYDSFKGELLSTKLLEDTVIFLKEIVKLALNFSVVLGPFESIFASHLSEKSQFNLKSTLKEYYASYDNFVEFVKNINQHKLFVGDDNFEVILL